MLSYTAPSLSFTFEISPSLKIPFYILKLHILFSTMKLFHTYLIDREVLRLIPFIQAVITRPFKSLMRDAPIDHGNKSCPSVALKHLLSKLTGLSTQIISVGTVKPSFIHLEWLSLKFQVVSFTSDDLGRQSKSIPKRDALNQVHCLTFLHSSLYAYKLLLPFALSRHPP